MDYVSAISLRRDVILSRHAAASLPRSFSSRRRQFSSPSPSRHETNPTVRSENVLFCCLAVLDPTVKWPHHGRTLSIYSCPLSFWLTLPRRVLSTSWCCPSRPCGLRMTSANVGFNFVGVIKPCVLSRPIARSYRRDPWALHTPRRLRSASLST